MKRSRACADLVALETHHAPPTLHRKRNKRSEICDLAFELSLRVDTAALEEEQLPATPFVQLARKKAKQKIERAYARPVISPQLQAPAQSAPEPTSLNPLLFSREQHEMLLKLLRIPEPAVLKLPTTQRNLVQFARRYDKIIKLSPTELQRLPVTQQQLLQQLRAQMPESLQRLGQHGSANQFL
ncbi:hypothetical protein P43SY_002305 [Pythium insidiosum]|uniref:Uncharacterized protein n=1 Tax=Pythium insidiosum TaxID=114742 RepID=A0AAD5QES1_PYTIN|nr:hypothetical protein P43SY_002305 [Pythium insidiosum]